LSESGDAEAALEDAVRWYHDQLDRRIDDHTDTGGHPERPTTVREYWRKRRDLEATTVEDKLLRWAPPNAGHELLEHLREAGHTDDAILGTGLFNKDEIIVESTENWTRRRPHYTQDDGIIDKYLPV